MVPFMAHHFMVKVIVTIRSLIVMVKLSMRGFFVLPLAIQDSPPSWYMFMVALYRVTVKTKKAS